MAQKISKFTGFVRGLSFDGNYFYIGQSEDMYLSRDMDIFLIKIIQCVMLEFFNLILIEIYLPHYQYQML